MPLDLKLKMLLGLLAIQKPPAPNEVPPAEARKNFRTRLAMVESPPEPVGRIEDREIPGPAGPIRLRVYTPAGRGPFPVLVYFHGGGWVIGDLETAESPCCALANATGAVVVSVDYRLAPEHKFPAAFDDCYAATLWVRNNATALEADPLRIAVGGDSAGGNLAAVVCLAARDRGGPPLVFQLLVYPAVDYDFNRPSYRENATGYLLTTELCQFFSQQYLGREEDRRNPYAAPMCANDLNGLPPALIMTAEYDPLRDEGAAYARRLEEAGVRVTLRQYAGLIHGFWNMGAVLGQVKSIRQEAAAALRSAFAVHTNA